jgi:hypothetical protein
MLRKALAVNVNAEPQSRLHDLILLCRARWLLEPRGQAVSEIVEAMVKRGRGAFVLVRRRLWLRLRKILIAIAALGRFDDVRLFRSATGTKVSSIKLVSSEATLHKDQLAGRPVSFPKSLWMSGSGQFRGKFLSCCLSKLPVAAGA